MARYLYILQRSQLRLVPFFDSGAPLRLLSDTQCRLVAEDSPLSSPLGIATLHLLSSHRPAILDCRSLV